MKYLNTTEFRKGVEAAIEELVAKLHNLKVSIDCALAADSACPDEMVSAYAVEQEMSAYRHVLNLLDEHTFDLVNAWGRYRCYMDGTPPEERPPVPCFHLSAKVQALVEHDPDRPLNHELVLMAKLVLATIKTFDDWLEERYNALDEYEHCEYLEMLDTIANQFHTLFGRPGFLQDAPDWMRKAFAWSYCEGDDEADAVSDNIRKWRASRG